MSELEAKLEKLLEEPKTLSQILMEILDTRDIRLLQEVEERNKVLVLAVETMVKELIEYVKQNSSAEVNHTKIEALKKLMEDMGVGRRA